MNKLEKKVYFEKYRKVPKNRTSHLLAAKKYRSANREKCRSAIKRWNDAHPESVAIWKRDHARRRRLACLLHYGKGDPHCVCCGEREIKFLALDHKNNDGASHRRAMRLSGDSVCSWIIKNGFPDVFQLLCHNCNMAKGFYGECPHKCSPTVLKPV